MARTVYELEQATKDLPDDAPAPVTMGEVRDIIAIARLFRSDLAGSPQCDFEHAGLRCQLRAGHPRPHYCGAVKAG